MKYYKDKENELYALDDDAGVEWVKDGWEQISLDELNAILDKKHPKEQPSQEDRFKLLHDEFIAKVDEIMNAKARSKGYDNIVTAVTYAGYPNDFQAEGIAFGQWRSKVYKWGYSLEDRFKSGELGIESFNLEEVLKDMPKLELKGVADE